jgi:preprotein translocase subunit YajC
LTALVDGKQSTYRMSTPSPAFIPFTLAQIGARPTDGGAAVPSVGAAPANPVAASSASGSTTTQSQGPSLITYAPLFVAMIVLMFVLPALSSRKDKKKRADLMSRLGKGDRVLTIGGQIGVVDQVRDQEVVLRIDENSNVKARFTKASIQTVLDSAGKPAGSTESGEPTIEVKAKSDNPVPVR